MKTKDEQSFIREELADAPLLSSLYGRPDGYTPLADDKREVMVKAVLSGTSARVETKRAVLPTTMIGGIRWWAVAAGICLLITAGIWWQQRTSVVSADYKGLASLSDEELEAYLEENLHSFDLALLLETGLIEEEGAMSLPATGTAPTTSGSSGKVSSPEQLEDDTL
jgi:hypothetical protein